MRALQKQAEDAQKEKEKTPKVIEAKDQLETAKAVATQAQLHPGATYARKNSFKRRWMNWHRVGG